MQSRVILAFVAVITALPCVTFAEDTVWVESPAAAAPCCTQVCDSGVFFSGDYLSWRPSTRGSDFAVSESGASTTLGTAQIHDATYDSDAGMRLRLGYQTSTQWSISATYSYFDTEGAASVVRPAGVGQLFATQSHPDGNEEAETADAVVGFDYSVFDLVIERPIFQNRFTDMRVFGGVRWSEIDRQSDVRYDGRDFVNALVAKDSKMRGAGLRMGTETSWLIANGFKLTGSVSGGLLFSETSTEYFETNFDDSVVLVDAMHNQDGSTPFLECSAGIGWQNEAVSVLVGYELQNWFGLHERSMFVDDIHEATFANISEDLLLSGLFVRSVVRF